MRTTMKMLTVLRAAAGGGVAAPVITTDAVIGTQLDAGAGYSTYQWQSSSDGATWADISGATAQTYTPTDAVFGLFLRVLGDDAASNSAGRVAEVPAQSATSTVSNPDMNWSGGTLTGWTLNAGTVGGDPGISEVAPDGSAGTGAVHLLNFNGTSNQPDIRAVNSLAELGEYYEISGDVSARTSGVARLRAAAAGFNTLQMDFSQVSIRKALVRNTAANDALAWVGFATTDIVINRTTGERITRNAQLAAPNADGRLQFFYTLPASPVQGDQYWAVVRGETPDALASGDYLLALLQYTGSQWNLTFHVVTDHTRGAAIITANNIGNTNGLAIVLDGDDISLGSTADGGENWTSRGNATNSTYNTATGVNVIHTAAFTAGLVTYDPES
jgi:hypothetical protein